MKYELGEMSYPTNPRFSNHWKNGASTFQTLEKLGAGVCIGHTLRGQNTGF